MNRLDELIAASAGVPDGTPDELGNAHAALDAAIVARMRQDSPAGRKAANRWWSGRRGMAFVGVAGVAAAVAATVIVIPSSSPHPATSPRADSSAKPTVKAKAPARAKRTATTPGTSPVSYTFTVASTDVTAAYVFQKAAQSTPDGNAPLVNGWPDAPYWQTVSQIASSTCPGVVETSTDWLARSGAVVVQNVTSGPKSSMTSACIGPTGQSTYPVYNNPSGPMIGGKIYTWSQFSALPTDPARLQSILAADATVGVAPDKGESESDFLFQTIGILLTSDPVSPALRKALYAVWAEIPGVTVSGQYTDSLGRTGTALSFGSSTTVVDISNGQVLAQLDGAPPIPPGCVRATTAGNPHASCVVGGSGTTVYISAGPVSSEPSV